MALDGHHNGLSTRFINGIDLFGLGPWAKSNGAPVCCSGSAATLSAHRVCTSKQIQTQKCARINFYGIQTSAYTALYESGWRAKDSASTIEEDGPVGRCRSGA